MSNKLRRWDDRLPPFDHEAERCFLGSLIVSRKQRLFCLTDDTLCGVGHHVFYNTDHETVYRAIKSVWNKAHHLDAVLLKAELDKTRKLEEIGGLPEIVKIMNAVPSAVHGPHYGQIIFAHWKRRQVIRMTADIRKMAYENADDEVIMERSEELSEFIGKWFLTNEPTKVNIEDII